MKRFLSILVVLTILATLVLGIIPAAVSAAPSTITTSTSTILSTENLVQYAVGLEWVFYYSSGYKYQTSSDGTTWSSATALTLTSSGNTNAFTTYFDGTYLYFLTPNGANTVSFRRATPVSNGTLTYSAVSQSVTITNTANTYLALTVDTNGYAWIGTGLTTTGSFANTVVKNANTDGTWSTASGYPLNLQTNASGDAVTYLVALSGGRVYAVVNYGSYNAVKGYLFNSTWGASESIYSTNTVSNFLAVATDGTNVYTMTPSYYSPFLYCDTRANSGTHTYAALPNVAGTATNTPVVASCTGTGAVTVYYENYSGKNVYYQQMVGSWQDPVLLSYESTDGLATNNNYFTAAPSLNTLVYYTKTGSPYNIKSVTAPTTSPDSVDLYWVGGSGSWSQSAHWSTSSGGSGGHATPNATNTVHFDANSWAGTSAGTINFDSSPCLCNGLDWTGENNPITVTQGGSENDVSGSLTLNSNITWSATSLFVLLGSGNVTTNGCTLVNVGLKVNTSGTYTLQDALTTSNTTGVIDTPLEVAAGTFDVNGKTLNLTTTLVSVLKVDGGTLTLGAASVTLANNTSGATFYVTSGIVNLNSATINITAASNSGSLFQVTGGTVNAGTSTFNLTGTYYNHTIFSGNGGTYYNLNVIGSAEIAGSNTFNAVTVNRSGGNVNLYLVAGTTQTVSAFSCAVSGTNTLTMRSTTTTPATIALANGYDNLDYLALSYIAGSPSTNTWYYGSNSTVGTAVTGWSTGVYVDTLDLYWVGGSGNWSSSAHWSTSSGGASGHGPPTQNNNIFFDANSFSTTGQTVTFDTTPSCKSMVWTGATNTPTLAVNNNNLHVSGATLTFITAMHITGIGDAANTWIGINNANCTITSAGQNLGYLQIGNNLYGVTFADTTLLSGIGYVSASSFSENVHTNSKIVIQAGATNITNAGAVSLISDLLGIGSYPVSVQFNYGATSSYGATTAAVNETATGHYSTAVTGLSAGTYHYQLVAVANSVTYTSVDMTFAVPGADSLPRTLTPSLQSSPFSTPSSDTPMIAGGYAYISGRSSGVIYQVNLSDYSDIKTYSLPNHDQTLDGFTVCNGSLWVGGGAHREIYQIAVPAMTLTNTIDVLHDNFNEVACNDGTYAYFGGVGNYICSVNCTTLAVTYGTVPADFGSAGMIHELAVDGTYLFGDLHQGGEQWKCSKTTLTGFVTAAGTGTLSNSEELLVDPTDTYVYNLTEAGGVTAVKRWSIADLSATSCVISDVVLGGLDSIVFLPDGSLLVSDCYQSSDTNGTTHLYRINPDFTYTPGQYLTVSGINSYAYRNNKIYLSSDTLYFIGGPFPTTSTTSIFSIPLGDIYQSQPAVLAAASIGYFGATISGTVDTGNIPATITVFYGLTDGGTTAANWQHSSAPTTPAQPQQTGAYSLTLSSLDQNTRYYYAVREVTALGTTWTPATQNFTTGQTMVGHFPLMTVLLQICPALIFMGLIFGLVFFSRRQGKEPSGLNLAGIIFFTMAMIMGLVMFQQIIVLFYNLLIQ